VQQEFLTSLGCTSLQGYLLSRPVRADKVAEAAPQLALAAKSAAQAASALLALESSTPSSK
jgi:EAL domain-containing protein (putative c-di-GMP-specific phosphodiesterase class I)